jgi:hypothetical protein
LNQFHFCNVDPDGNPFEYGRISWGELNQWQGKADLTSHIVEMESWNQHCRKEQFRNSSNLSRDLLERLKKYYFGSNFIQIKKINNGPT